ncbi:hypothetical protein ACVWY7_000591 [Bacillus sp. TE9106W]
MEQQQMLTKLHCANKERAGDCGSYSFKHIIPYGKDVLVC